MGKYFTLALLVLAGNVHAQTVFKCRDHRGQPVYQSFPCAAGAPVRAGSQAATQVAAYGGFSAGP